MEGGKVGRGRVMWRGKGGISVSRSHIRRWTTVGTGPVQRWYAKILTLVAVNIHARSSPSSRLWRTKPCPWSVIRVYMFLLHFQGQWALGGVGGCLLEGEAVAATCFSQREASSGVELLGHDKWMWPQVITVCLGPMKMAQDVVYMPPPIFFMVVTISSQASTHYQYTRSCKSDNSWCLTRFTDQTVSYVFILYQYIEYI